MIFIFNFSDNHEFVSELYIDLEITCIKYVCVQGRLMERVLEDEMSINTFNVFKMSYYRAFVIIFLSHVFIIVFISLTNICQFLLPRQNKLH